MRSSRIKKWGIVWSLGVLSALLLSSGYPKSSKETPVLSTAPLTPYHQDTDTSKVIEPNQKPSVLPSTTLPLSTSGKSHLSTTYHWWHPQGWSSRQWIILGAVGLTGSIAVIYVWLRLSPPSRKIDRPVTKSTQVPLSTIPDANRAGKNRHTFNSSKDQPLNNALLNAGLSEKNNNTSEPISRHDEKDLRDLSFNQNSPSTVPILKVPSNEKPLSTLASSQKDVGAKLTNKPKTSSERSSRKSQEFALPPHRPFITTSSSNIQLTRKRFESVESTMTIPELPPCDTNIGSPPKPVSPYPHSTYKHMQIEQYLQQPAFSEQNEDKDDTKLVTNNNLLSLNNAQQKVHTLTHSQAELAIGAIIDDVLKPKKEESSQIASRKNSRNLSDLSLLSHNKLINHDAGDSLEGPKMQQEPQALRSHLVEEKNISGFDTRQLSAKTNFAAWLSLLHKALEKCETDIQHNEDPEKKFLESIQSLSRHELTEILAKDEDFLKQIHQYCEASVKKVRIYGTLLIFHANLQRISKQSNVGISQSTQSSKINTVLPTNSSFVLQQQKTESLSKKSSSSRKNVQFDTTKNTYINSDEIRDDLICPDIDSLSTSTDKFVPYTQSTSREDLVVQNPEDGSMVQMVQYTSVGSIVRENDETCSDSGSYYYDKHLLERGRSASQTTLDSSGRHCLNEENKLNNEQKPASTA